MDTTSADPDAIRRWLRILHGGSPGRLHIVATDAWAGPSCEPGDVDAAVTRAIELDTKRPAGIYVRMTTLARPLKPGTRGGAADSQALTALWADLDIAGPAHEDQNLPPDWASVVAIVDRSGLPTPTLWIDSGHGAYPVWLLTAPHLLTDDTMHDAMDLSANWQKVIGRASEILGWHYGTGVGDLARVLRIPGTINRKIPGDPRPCRIVAETVTPQRYTVDALYAAVADASARLTPPEPVRTVPAASTVTLSAKPGIAGPGLSPGDDFAERTSWAEILEPHGWTRAGRRGHIEDWRRPGKKTGISATVNATHTDRLHVLTTASVFDTTSYSKLGAYAVLEYGGDISAAASALKARDFGTNLGRNDQAIQDFLSGATDSLPWEAPGGEGPRPPGETIDPASPLDATSQRELKFRHEVAIEAYRLKVRREARKKVDHDDFATTWREPPSRLTLADELALPDDPIRYRIDRLLPVDGNAVLIAAFKAGKTTMCNNLLRSFADGEPFLNRFDVVVPDGRTAVFNYEVSEGQYRRWLRKIGIANPDRISLLNLRGFTASFTNPLFEDWLVKWLGERDVKAWIVDPLARALAGGDENSNVDVGLVLEALDVIKSRAGVRELILPVHTGRQEQSQGSERARGATRVDDWADARWLLTTDSQGRRFFRAHGRDVEADEEMLTLDTATGRLTMGGYDRRGMACVDELDDLVDWVRDNPGLGLNEIYQGVGGQKQTLAARLSSAVAARRLYVVEAANRKRLHYVTGTVPGHQEGDVE